MKLFQRRRIIAELVESPTRHLGTLDALGDGGMSSDESSVDPDTHQTTYMVSKPEWRHLTCITGSGSSINAYDLQWIESRKLLYLDHVLHPQREQRYDSLTNNIGISP